MGIIENIKSNIGDIAQGVKDVISGRTSTPYTRSQAQLTREAEKIASRTDTVTDVTTSYTPVKDTSGKVTYYSGGSSRKTTTGTTTTEIISPTTAITPTTTTPTTTITPTTQESLRNQTQVTTRSGGGGVRVTRPGEASRTYIGKAYIEELGMTANEYKRLQAQKAREQLGGDKGGRLRYFSKAYLTKEEEKEAAKEEVKTETKEKLPTLEEVKAQTLEVQPVVQPTGLGKVTRFFEVKRGELSTKAARGQEAGVGLSLLGGVGAGAVSSIAGTAQFAKSLFTKPVTTIKETGKGILETGKRGLIGEGLTEVSSILRTEPGYAAGYILGEVAQAGVGTKVIEIGTGALGRIPTKLSPKYVKSTPSGITLKSGETLGFAGKVDDIAIPVSRQVELAGTKVKPVSAARDLFGTLKKKIVVEKPLPTPTSPQLERAFFADPFGRVRKSRLGLVDDTAIAGVVDILSGDVTFKKPKPQIIKFGEQTLATFPEELSSIRAKLTKGQSLTPTEIAKLEKFQLTPTGEFKPLGFISKEPEVILAPGEIIRKTGTEAVTLIEGRRVPIITAEVATPTSKLQSLLQKTIRTAAEEKELTKLLTKQTGFDVSSILTTSKYVSPVVPVSAGIGVSKLLSSPLLSISTSQVAPSMISYSTNGAVEKPSSIIGVSSESGSSMISYSVTPSKDSSIVGVSNISKAPGMLKKGGALQPISKIWFGSLIETEKREKQEYEQEKQLAKKRLLKRADESQGYIAQVKEKGKWKNVSDIPYLKSEAIKLAKHTADRTISASARIKPTNKEPAKDILSLMVNNRKFRDYAIRGGSKIPLENTWIEKRTHRLDVKNEVQTLQQYKKSAAYKNIFSGSTPTREKSYNFFGSSAPKKKGRAKKYNWF